MNIKPLHKFLIQLINAKIILILILIFSYCAESSGRNNTSDKSSDEIFSGGGMTIFDSSSQAYAQPAPNLNDRHLDLHLQGDAQFEVVFTENNTLRAGLGPRFNDNSCVSCHPSDGRGRPPFKRGGDDAMVKIGFFLRMSLPGAALGEAPKGVAVGDRNFGTQLQDKVTFVAGQNAIGAEGEMTVTYEETAGEFPDGENYSLRYPNYSILEKDLDFPDDLEISPRVAPPVFGRGLLESISEEDILKNEDPQDKNGDGITGIANRVWNPISKKTGIGRFGLKGGNTGVAAQTMGAYLGDMGVTSSVFAEEFPEVSENPSHLISHGGVIDYPEDNGKVPDSEAKATSFYVLTLAVPARRDIDKPDVKKGKKLFNQIGCNSCHIAAYTTGENFYFHAPDGSKEKIEELSNQHIYPYTDLLLHDMGPDLADNRSEFWANGYQWKTPALWGLGLLLTVNGHTNLLHDGRARDFQEAILWHGGEAQKSKKKYMNLSRKERKQLLAFLWSL